MGISPFKANYGYKLKILLSPKQVKKSSEIAKERVETFINLYNIHTGIHKKVLQFKSI
jgi:hypothetical protein